MYKEAMQNANRIVEAAERNSNLLRRGIYLCSPLVKAKRLLKQAGTILELRSEEMHGSHATTRHWTSGRRVCCGSVSHP